MSSSVEEVRKPVVHQLKCWPIYYQASRSRLKPFEFRRNDRDYRVGDYVLLKEYDIKTLAFTGDTLPPIKITYLLPVYVATAGEHVILGLEPSIYNTEIAALRQQLAVEKRRADAAEHDLYLLQDGDCVKKTIKTCEEEWRQGRRNYQTTTNIERGEDFLRFLKQNISVTL